MVRELALSLAGALVALGCPSGSRTAAAGETTPPAVAPVVPARLEARVVNTYPHDPEAFTQGLIWHRGRVLESTGLHGRSGVRRVRLEDGVVEARAPLPDSVFGEGIALVGDRLWQLSWQEGRAFVWSAGDLSLRGEKTYRGEGWGLCFDGKRLVRSDGSEMLTFHDAETFAVLGTLPVTFAGHPLYGLNELECVGTEVWANVWQTDSLVRIDASSGRITAKVDVPALLSEAERAQTDVLNGIAYRPETDTFLLTGKLWPKLFEVKFEPAR